MRLIVRFGRAKILDQTGPGLSGNPTRWCETNETAFPACVSDVGRDRTTIRTRSFNVRFDSHRFDRTRRAHE